MASMLPSFSNVIHKVACEVALWNQLKAGLKSSNRKIYSATITANNTPVVFTVPYFDGAVESIVVASPSGATTSTSGNSVTITVVNKNGGAVLLTGDTFSNLTELAINTGAFFANPGPAISNGARTSQFKGGDCLELNALVTGTPGITNTGTLNITVHLTPTDPRVGF